MSNENNAFSDNYINLAEERLGTVVLETSDDFFAEKENLIKPGRGVFIEDKYTDRGKWMDGWESRRKRTEGNDYCIIKLGLSGVIHGVDIDTNHFTGNHPEFSSLEACCIDKGNDEGNPNDETKWDLIVPKLSMKPGSQHLVAIDHFPNRYTHVRLQIFPDGGVARLRVYGEVVKDWSGYKPGEILDLAAVENGGKAVACNDMYFSHKDNIIAPGRGINMGDGWETKRKRGLTKSSHDWLIIQLAKQGKIKNVTIDTKHFKGNFPDSFSLEAVCIDEKMILEMAKKDLPWKELLPKQKLKADSEHLYGKELIDLGNLTHVRIKIYPDGGVSRLRLFGEVTL